MHELHLGVLAVLGICVAGGVVGAWLFQKLKIPQVVGYIVVGVLIGDTGFGLLHPEDIVALRPFNNFALGLIGFLVGGELSASIFKKYGKQFTAILLGEGLAAFFLVAGSRPLPPGWFSGQSPPPPIRPRPSMCCGNTAPLAYSPPQLSRSWHLMTHLP